MPNQADVALAILTLMLAFIAVVGQQLRCVLEWSEHLLLALPRRRAVVGELGPGNVRVARPVQPIPHRGDGA